MINGVISAYNATAGNVFGKVETINNISMSGDIAKLIGDVDSWVGESPGSAANLSRYRLQYKNANEYFGQGYNAGVGIENSIQGIGRYQDSLIGYNPINVGVSGDDWASPIIDGIDVLKGNTSDIADNTKVSSEELKYLRDIAELEVINRFTTAEIKIENNMNNNINSDRDLDGIVNYITNEMYRAASSTAEGLHY